MKYDLCIPEEKEKALKYFNLLADRGEKCEVKRIRPPRTLRQNNYVHSTPEPERFR